MSGFSILRKIRGFGLLALAGTMCLSLQAGAEEYTLGVQDRVKRLEGILPTCMYCKKIRDEQDQWVGIEAYISKRSQASFSHGVCPSCYETVLKQELTRLKSV